MSIKIEGAAFESSHLATEPQMANEPDNDEDRRLVRLGIDPDGNPVEIMRQVDAKLKALKKPSEEPAEGHKPEVDRLEESR